MEEVDDTDIFEDEMPSDEDDIELYDQTEEMVQPSNYSYTDLLAIYGEEEEKCQENESGLDSSGESSTPTLFGDDDIDNLDEDQLNKYLKKFMEMEKSEVA